MCANQWICYFIGWLIWHYWTWMFRCVMSPLHNIYCTPLKVFMVIIVTLQNTEFHNNDKQPNWGPVQRRAVIGWDLTTVLEWSLMHRSSRRHITMLIHNSKTDILCSWRRTMNACSLRQARRQEQTATRWAVLSTTAWILVLLDISLAGLHPTSPGDQDSAGTATIRRLLVTQVWQP